MSLDFWLKGEEITEECICNCCDNSHMRRYTPTVFDGNLTHNLGKMADAAGIYKCLWRPEENGFKLAKDILPLLEKGYLDLCENPNKFDIFTPKNSWGSLQGLKEFVCALIEACKQHPESTIDIWR